MITIVEPKDYITKLWGKQKIRFDDTYRIMRYVVQVSYTDKLLLHNVITGQLVVLDNDEKKYLEKLPMKYNDVLRQLVDRHYLVPEGYDEHQLVVNLRKVLRDLYEAQKTDEITYYTILPTTACNARCYYCFQKGVTVTTMSEETANDVVDFIAANCGNKHVTIRWFGGEPTLAVERINQICEGLQKKGVEYTSFLTTNGFLLDTDTVNKAKQLWNLRQATITVDGTETNYNRIKSFVTSCDNPYQKVMHNIAVLLENEVYVGIRMNFNRENYLDFDDLLRETKQRFGENPYLKVYSHQINEDFIHTDKGIVEEYEEWCGEKQYEMDLLVERSKWSPGREELPCLEFLLCEAANRNSATITPAGDLVCCAEQIGDDQIKGNVQKGIINNSLVESWRQYADNDKCVDCALFPDCVKLSNCNSKNRCFGRVSAFKRLRNRIINTYNMKEHAL